MDATRQKRGLLYRSLKVHTPEGSFTVEYNGRGMGHETVSVNGKVASQPRSETWFVPRFSFRIGSRPAILTVRVWPWLAIRSMQLLVDEETVYHEGAVEQVTTGYDKKAWRISGLMVMGILVILVMIPVFIIASSQRSRLVAVHEWHSASGVVLSVETESYTYLRSERTGSYRRTVRETRYRPIVTYDYSVGDAKYTGDRITLSQFQRSYETRQDAQEHAQASYHTGQTVIVYYNPADPGEAIIERPPISEGTRLVTSAVGFFVGVAGLLLIIGIVLTVAERWRGKMGTR